VERKYADTVAINVRALVTLTNATTTRGDLRHTQLRAVVKRVH